MFRLFLSGDLTARSIVSISTYHPRSPQSHTTNPLALPLHIHKPPLQPISPLFARKSSIYRPSTCVLFQQTARSNVLLHYIHKLPL
ncbi:hypothetical protein SK128_016280, partial [Halocaridina rubra]